MLLIAYFGEGIFACCVPSQLKLFAEIFNECYNVNNSRGIRTAIKIHATAEIPIVRDIGRGHGIDSDDSKSEAGYIFYDSENLTTWGSSKQETVVLLSCEAEDMTRTEFMEQAIWFQELHRHTSGSE